MSNFFFSFLLEHPIYVNDNLWDEQHHKQILSAIAIPFEKFKASAKQSTVPQTHHLTCAFTCIANCQHFDSWISASYPEDLIADCGGSNYKVLDFLISNFQLTFFVPWSFIKLKTSIFQSFSSAFLTTSFLFS